MVHSAIEEDSDREADFAMQRLSGVVQEGSAFDAVALRNRSGNMPREESKAHV